MQPQQPYQPPLAAPVADYDFIMNSPKPSRPNPFSAISGRSKSFKLLIIGGAVVLFIILLVVIKSAGGNGAIPYMVSLAQDQHELLHLATAGSAHTTDINLTNFAYTAQLTMLSEQQAMTAYLKANGHNVGSGELDLKVSKSTDAQLAGALSGGGYDTAFKTIMQSRLQTYQSDLRQAYQYEKGSKGRALISDDFNDVGLLLKQLAG